MNRRVVWVAVVAGMALAGPARAERPLSYADALQGAVANNGTLVTSELARAQSEASLLGAQGQFDPLYSLDASWRQSRNQGFFQGFPFTSDSKTWTVTNSLGGITGTGTSYGLNVSLDRNASEFTTNFGIGGDQVQVQDAFTGNINASVSQEFLRGIRFRYNVQNVTQARQALTSAELSVVKQRQQSLYGAAEAYWTWVYQAQLHDIATNSVEVANEALRVGRLQVESGQLAPVEATRLEAALVQAQQSEIDAENASEQAANAMLLLMGESPDQQVIPATAAGDVPAAIDLDPEQAVEVALQQNLDLAIAVLAVDTAKIDEANAKHGILPSLTGTAAAGVASQRCPPGTDNVDCVVGNGLDALTGVTADDNQPFLQLSGLFTVPLGNRGARGDRDRAVAVVVQRERELMDLQRSVSAQVEEQVRALQSARRRMELADVNQRLSDETLAAEEALAEAGRSIQKDVLEARTEVDRTRAEAAKARTDFRLAQARLLQLQGQLTEGS